MRLKVIQSLGEAKRGETLSLVIQVPPGVSVSSSSWVSSFSSSCAEQHHPHPRHPLSLFCDLAGFLLIKIRKGRRSAKYFIVLRTFEKSHAVDGLVQPLQSVNEVEYDSRF